MKNANVVARTTATLFLTTALMLGESTIALAQYGQGGGKDDHDSRQNDRGGKQDDNRGGRDDHGDARDKDDHGAGEEKVLYIWAQDQAQVAPDFLAVVDFDERSPKYGEVINVVPLPPPGNTGNEPHHCHLNSTKTILGCGGLLSLLKGQNGIFFFDVKDAKKPRFLFSAKAVESSMTDDFMPLENGGFLITQMGSANGMAPGRVAEFDGNMHFVANHFGPWSLFQEWPSEPPLDGFNPHGISARPDLNLMMTSDFILPSSTLMGSMGPVLRGSVRIWDYRERKITKTVDLPHVDSSTPGGMGQIMATPQSGDRLIIGTFMAGQVVMLDATDRHKLKQVSVVSFGENSGPHNIVLSSDDNRLVVTDYFLNEDAAGIIHFEGDHKVHVLKVTHDTLTEDKRFKLDFNTAFKTGPARPHGIAMK